MCGKLYENGLYGEPEKGDMEKVLSSAQDGPARVLDLGEQWWPSPLLQSCAGTEERADLALIFRCDRGVVPGCGSTVTWLISMAERFPEVEFIGVGKYAS